MATKPNDDNILSHTRWNCKCLIASISKYRRENNLWMNKKESNILVRF